MYEHPLRPHGWFSYQEMAATLGNLLGSRPDTRLRTYLMYVIEDDPRARRIGVGKKSFRVYSPEVMVSFADACRNAGEISAEKFAIFAARYSKTLLSK